MAQDEFWTKLKRRLREVSTAAADFAEEQAVIGKLKFEILGLKRRIDTLHCQIGARTVELSQARPSPNPLKDPEVMKMLNEIRTLESQVATKRDEISRVADQVRTRKAFDTPDRQPKAGSASVDSKATTKRGRTPRKSK